MFKNTIKENRKFINEDLEEINKILGTNYEIKSFESGTKGIKDNKSMATLMKSKNLDHLAENINTLLHFMQLAQDTALGTLRR